MLLITTLTYSQEVGVAIDPYPLYDGQGIDITVIANADMNILKRRFVGGILFEWFPNIKYFSYQGTFDYPYFFTENIETRIGVEYGMIIRQDVVKYKEYPEEGTSDAGFRTYGANASICYWFSEHLGAFSALNYKYRSDSVYIWEEGATEWEYSVRVGIKYKFQ